MGYGTHSVRRFCDWSRVFSLCQVSNEVSEILNHASTIAKDAGSGTLESEFVLKSLLKSGLIRGKVSHDIPLGTASLARELDCYIRRRHYSKGDNRIGPSTSSALLYAQSLAIYSNKSVGPSELVEGLVQYDSFLQNLKNKRLHSETSKRLANVENYLLDLTSRARTGCLGLLVGREAELERLKRTLGRMRKSNVLIVGPAGVGKTALVERLALDLLDEDDSITVLMLDLCGLYSGQGTRGELESKLKAIFDRITNGNTILFIDEIHHLIQNQEGGLNVTNLFKPIMTSGVKIIGSTTVKEYHQYFRLDRAFERRFEILRLHENTTDESLVILYGVRPKLEAHHNVEITNDAILASVTMTQRFIPRRVLPDKAIDVLDEAAMLVRQSSTCHRHALEELTQRKNRLIVDMIHNGDSESTMSAAIADIEACEAELRASQAAQRELRRQLRSLQQLQQDYEKGGNLLKASELHNHKIPELLKSLERLQMDSANVLYATVDTCAGTGVSDDKIADNPTPQMDYKDGNSENCYVDIVRCSLKSRCVDKLMVAEVVSRQTGIPVGVLLQSPMVDRQANLDVLNTSFPGHYDAVRSTWLHFYERSCGITGTDMTAGILCCIGSPDKGIRALLQHISSALGLGLKCISCSQLHTANSTNILIGSPPGYVGYREGGVLSEWMKESPYSIIVFDGAELMHANVLNLISSAIDTGSLIDNLGEECRLDKCFIVFVYSGENLVHPTVRDRADDTAVFK